MVGEKHILSMASQKKDLMNRRKLAAFGLIPREQIVFSPLELFTDPDWQETVVPKNTVYVTAAASSGGYRALLRDILSLPANGDTQHQIIQMNTKLITNMVNQAALPEELQEKTFIIPHNIGTDVPGEQGTLLGKSEAHLMMQWLMRIAGVTPDTAELFSEIMYKEHQQVLDIIGDPKIEKSSKESYYLELIQTFFDVLNVSKEPIRPFSSIILGFDWKNSLGSRLEAAVAQKLNIPTYEMVLDENHPDFQPFIDSYQLAKIRSLIHLPTIKGAGQNLVTVQNMDSQVLNQSVGNILSQLQT